MISFIWSLRLLVKWSPQLIYTSTKDGCVTLELLGLPSKLVLARAHTKLVDTLLQEAKRDGLKLIVLDVFEDNLPARVLYTKFGFKKVGKNPKPSFGKADI